MSNSCHIDIHSHEMVLHGVAATHIVDCQYSCGMNRSPHASTSVSIMTGFERVLKSLRVRDPSHASFRL